MAAAAAALRSSAPVDTTDTAEPEQAAAKAEALSAADVAEKEDGPPAGSAPATTAAEKIATGATATAATPATATTVEPAAGGGPDRRSPDTEVIIVQGIGRYHRGGCILIRFMGPEDLESMTLRAAEAAGCVPCKACRPEQELADD